MSGQVRATLARALGVERSVLARLARPGPHERALERHFGGPSGLVPRDGMAIDAHLVVIAFTNRSGSTLLAEYVRQGGRVGGGGEYLNHDAATAEAARHGIGSLPGYLAHLHRVHGGGGRGLALKASCDQLAMLLRHRLTDLFAQVTVLHVVRRDLLAQAVSYAIALETGRWTSHHAGQASTRQPELAWLDRMMAEIQGANLGIEQLVGAFGLRRWEVSYEQMCMDPPEHVRRVLVAAGLAPPGWVPRPPALDRMADETNAAIIRAYRDAVRAALGHPGSDVGE